MSFFRATINATKYHVKTRVTSIVTSSRSFIHQHPTAFKIAVTSFSVAAALAIFPLSLTLVGFSAAGPVAGSFAALWQSSIGLVSAGSLFAGLAFHVPLETTRWVTRCMRCKVPLVRSSPGISLIPWWKYIYIKQADREDRMDLIHLSTET